MQQAESSASRIRHQPSVQNDGGTQGQETSVHVSSATGQPGNQDRTPVRERILDARRQAQDGDTHNVINARWRGDTEARAVMGYHLRRGGRYDSCTTKGKTWSIAPLRPKAVTSPELVSTTRWRASSKLNTTRLNTPTK
jgi:hypothetical protein